MISLIATIKNEHDSLSAWFESLLSQTVLPDEIVIVDGGSSDGTWEWLQEAQARTSILHVFQKEGNISVGRNEAIRQAKGEYIAVADAGCIYSNNWFASLTSPLAKGALCVTTAFGPLLHPTAPLRDYLIAAATIPRMKEFQTDWLPSSRTVAFSRSLWQTVGGYPEWLPICEDVFFDIALLQRGTQITYIRDPLVFWAPRSSVSAYARQLFQYTKGDGHAHLFWMRQCVRYGVYSGAITICILAILIAPLFLLFFFLAPVYLAKFYSRFFVYSASLSLVQKVVGVGLLPFIVGIGDLAKMLGWPIGLWERYTKRITPKT